MSKGAPSLALVECNFFIGFSIHDALVPIPAPPFVMDMKMPHVSIDVVQGLYLFASLSNRKGQSVEWHNLHYVGRTSDASLLVPHIDCPNLLLILTILFGSSMAVWGSSGTAIGVHSTILGNGSQSMACSCFPHTRTSLNLGCSWPVPLPLDILFLFGNTYVGFTWGDFVAGLIDIAIQMAIEVATLALGAVIHEIPFGKILSKCKGLFTAAAEDAVDEAAGSVERDVVQDAMEESWTAGKIGNRASVTAMDDVVDEEASTALDAGDSRIEDLIEDSRYVADDAAEDVAEEDQTVIRKASVSESDSIADDVGDDAAGDAEAGDEEDGLDLDDEDAPAEDEDEEEPADLDDDEGAAGDDDEEASEADGVEEQDEEEPSDLDDDEDDQTVIRKASMSASEDAVEDEDQTVIRKATVTEVAEDFEESATETQVEKSVAKIVEEAAEAAKTAATLTEKLMYMAQQVFLEYGVSIAERACEIGNSWAEGVDDDQFEVFAYWQPADRDVVISAVSGEDETDDRFQFADDS